MGLIEAGAWVGGGEGGAGGSFPTPFLFCTWQGSVGFLGSGVPERVNLIPGDVMTQANWGPLEDAGEDFLGPSTLPGENPAGFLRLHTN